MFLHQTEKLLLVLRDGRKIFGVLRSWDQFANLVLTDTRERYFVSVPSSSEQPSSSSSETPAAPTTRNLYCDIPRGTYLVRGENVLLLGEVDLDRDDEPPQGYVEETSRRFSVYRNSSMRKGRRAIRSRARNWRICWVVRSKPVAKCCSEVVGGIHGVGRGKCTIRDIVRRSDDSIWRRVHDINGWEICPMVEPWSTLGRQRQGKRHFVSRISPSSEFVCCIVGRSGCVVPGAEYCEMLLRPWVVSHSKNK